MRVQPTGTRGWVASGGRRGSDARAGHTRLGGQWRALHLGCSCLAHFAAPHIAAPCVGGAFRTARNGTLTQAHCVRRHPTYFARCTLRTSRQRVAQLYEYRAFWASCHAPPNIYECGGQHADFVCPAARTRRIRALKHVGLE